MISNTSHSYGAPARLFHWLTAFLILSALGLGLYAGTLPRETGAEAETLKTVFSLHKTIGVAAFFTALLRILWTFTQPRPAPIHPERRAETHAAELVHWALYGAMLVMPFSGWILHAAETGFAPILWPFGQGLPFVPKSESIAHIAKAVHELSALVLYGAVGLHLLGALKHALFDRDATLARMTRGIAAGGLAHARTTLAPLAALVLWGGIVGSGLALTSTPPSPAQPPIPAPPVAATGNWQVTEGALAFSVLQMGAHVEGSLPNWTAAIAYDETTGTGTVRVEIDTTTLRLGSVSDQAKGAEFFDTAAHPTAVFDAKITRTEGPEHLAEGTLTLRGETRPLALPFTLTIAEGTARMSGEVPLDRRDYGMGQTYQDESTVGFGVTVNVALTARRVDS